MILLYALRWDLSVWTSVLDSSLHEGQRQLGGERPLFGGICPVCFLCEGLPIPPKDGPAQLSLCHVVPLPWPQLI